MTDYQSSICSAIVSLIEPIYTEPPALTVERRKVCVDLAGLLAQVIERWDQKSAPDWDWEGYENPRAGVVASVLHIFASISATAQMEQFVTHVLEDKPHYNLHDVLIPDVKAIHTWLPESSRGAICR